MGGDAARFMERARDFRRRYQAPEGLFWLRRVNHTVGALIAYLLLPSRVTPNALTVAGIVAHVVPALVVAAVEPRAPPWLVLLVALAWQLAFSLDCADGPLARARGESSSFGAWFDQIADTIAHAAVHGALAIYVGRALDFEAGPAAALAAFSVALSLLQTFTTWQRTALVSRDRPVGDSPSLALRIVYAARHLVDWGAFLFVSSLLLLFPPGLLALLVAMGVLNTLYVLMQLALGWRKRPRGSDAHREEAASAR